MQTAIPPTRQPAPDPTDHDPTDHDPNGHAPAERHPAVVWLDRWHALVARREAGRPTVTEVERAFDAEPAYLHRVLREAEGCDRLVVLGPEPLRVALEREYVSLYRRPERIIDAGMEPAPAESDLVDRLRLVERLSA